MTQFKPMPNQPTISELNKTLCVPVNTNVIVIDTETTGLNCKRDEVLSLAITDLNGNKLFYSFIKPNTRRRWPDAQEVHGIAWQDVKNQPTLYDLVDDIMPILENADYIVGYNIGFDLAMLKNSGLPELSKPTYDLMECYANCYGRFSPKKNGYIYFKLTKVAENYGYKYEAHDALSDAKATAFCFQCFRKECEKELPYAQAREIEMQNWLAEEKKAEVSRVKIEIVKLIINKCRGTKIPPAVLLVASFIVVSVASSIGLKTLTGIASITLIIAIVWLMKNSKKNKLKNGIAVSSERKDS